jgi:signal transduction histidine kinase
VGIRILEDGQALPYAAYVGFEREFWEKENLLNLSADTCACIRVAAGTAEQQDRPAMTAGGSFCLSDAATFIQSLTPQQRARFRGTCIASGYATLAVLPLRYQGQTIGVIHMADRRKGTLPPEAMTFLESRMPLIAEAISRFKAEAELAQHREHLEELVEQKTAELRQTAEKLARSNKELDQFASIVGHDLQEPLRMVSSFLASLEERSGPVLDDKAKQFVHYARDGATRMTQLIKDLLDFARVQTRAREPVAADLNAAFDLAVANCTVAIGEAQANVSRGQLPTVQGDPMQLTQLLQNLIGNAVKFRKAGTPPQVRVDSARDGGQWQVWVEDNGIGIAPQHTERIFEVFQRLHGRDEYPGTGIGLAICKKIVERHGGQIHVESEEGKGSKFVFSLPAP